jgi:UDP-N-acetylmuramate dehydrogenase
VTQPVARGLLIRQNIKLAPYTSWLVGGQADFLAEPTNEEEMRQAILFSCERQLPITFLGGGTNVLISDRGVRGLVVALKKYSAIQAREEEGRLKIEALSGTSKSELLKVFLKYKLEPAVFLAGVPGDIGGGVVMNAGVGEMIRPREFVEITDAIETWQWDTSGVVQTQRFENADLSWSYRHCEGWRTQSHASFIAKVWLSWPLEPKDDVLLRVRAANQLRLTKQPLDMPSCGSVFVNPVGTSAGRLIEATGLKGFTIGGAKVSEKHANFIVNTGAATASDISQVISHVQNRVLAEAGISLKTEVVWLGEWS